MTADGTMDGPPAGTEPDTRRAGTVAAVLLAAGAGSRFDGPTHKLLAQLTATGDRPAESVIARSLAHCLDAAIGPTIVITGAADIGHVVDEVVAQRVADTDTGTHSEARAVPVLVEPNPDWRTGQMSSVRRAITTAADLHVGIRRVVIGLGDQPGVTAEAWRTVAAAGASAPITVATYDGRRGNPVSLAADVWSLLPPDGDRGARALMQIRPDLVREVPCDGSADDIDTVEDLQQWQSS